MLKVILYFVLLFVVANNEQIQELRELRRINSKKIKLVKRSTTVNIQQYPHQVSLELNGKFWCGGSIISEDFILTAAHCTYRTERRSWKVRAGTSFILKGGATYDVTFMISHPNFNRFSRIDYDIAVMKTSNRMSFNGLDMKPVRLATPGAVLRAGESIKLAGWGSTTGIQGDVSNKLQAATLHVVNRGKCQYEWWRLDIRITDRMFCGGISHFGGVDCYGDSGGAVIAEMDRVQYGIVSFGYGFICGDTSAPNVYTNIAALRRWIKDVTGV